jgi:hypothetical protein
MLCHLGIMTLHKLLRSKVAQQHDSNMQQSNAHNVLVTAIEARMLTSDTYVSVDRVTLC